VDPRVGLDEIEKLKFFTLPGLELRPLGGQSVVSCYIDYALPTPYYHTGGVLTSVVFKVVFKYEVL
jgi:hypothetical protein